MHTASRAQINNNELANTTKNATIAINSTQALN